MEDDDDRPTTDTSAPDTRADQGPPARDTKLGPGADIGGYIIDGEIGKGGMGFVYSATHPVIGKRAAIKVLKPDVSRSPIVLERFIQEARAVNQIGHPNIIDIFAFGQLPDGRAYHIMDLLVGESLRKRLRRGPLHPSEAASVIDEIASALIAAHEKGFVHRDLKPDNVFLVEIAGRWPEVKLLDFGLAKLMPEAGKAPFQTKTGVMLGTPEYMSPEQARGVGVDYRTDVYALGVLTFEILAGVRPFPSLGDSFLTLQAHAEEPPPSIADLVPQLPVELVQLVAAMLAKEQAARPSLAAVRTVIKRLRTTQLPSRTAAGLEVPSLPPMPSPVPGPLTDPAQSLGDVRPSRLGAEPVIPVATVPLIESSASPGSRVRPASSSNPPGASSPSHVPPPGSAAAIPIGSSNPPSASSSQPGRPATSPASSSQPLGPTHAPSASTHGRGSGGSAAMPLAPGPASSPAIRPGTHDSGRPGSTSSHPGPASSASSGLASTGGQPNAGTVLGVGVPNTVKSAAAPAPAPAPARGRTPSAGPASESSRKQPAKAAEPRPSSEKEKRTSGTLLVLGALLAIAIGVGLALALLERL